MSRKISLRLIPVVFLLHNAEEALLLRRFLLVDSARLPEVLHSLVPPVTYPQFLVALAVVTPLPFLFAALGNLERKGSLAVYALLVTAAVLFLNAFLHAGSVAVLGKYVPGLATALLLNLPLTAYLLWRATREPWVSRRALLSLPS